MQRQIEELIEWYSYILKFHPVKYLGIAIMAIGSLAVIYRYIFLSTGVYELLFGIAGSFIIGIIVWFFGWDPYA
ncbi:MAG: hypothetical protein HGA85_03090 [Nanoarchaeota archaeon]|nr:hypothetical protein [Nanoarchaeota archaeon]